MTKRNIFVAMIVSVIVVCLIALVYSNNDAKFKYNSLKSEKDKLNKYLRAQNSVEGKYIWDINLISKRYYQDSLAQYFNSYKVLFWYDSVGCSRCYNFHLNNLQKNIGKDKSVILYNGKYLFLKKDFRQFKFVKQTNQDVKFRQLVLLINHKGKIIYADFPQYELLENQGIAFYEKCLRY